MQYVIVCGFFLTLKSGSPERVIKNGAKKLEKRLCERTEPD